MEELRKLLRSQGVQPPYVLEKPEAVIEAVRLAIGSDR